MTDLLTADVSTTPDRPDAVPGGAGTVVASAFLAAAGFGWVAGSIFEGQLARGVGLLGALVGVASVAASVRSSRPAVVQYAGAVVGVVVGALLVVPSVRGGTDLTGLVVEALRNGGLGQPPVAFDPGWHFLLLVAVALVGEAAGGLALAAARPRLAPLVVLPFVVGAALLQPPGGELTGTLVGLLLLLAALGVSVGSDLAGDGTASRTFEVRRLARGAVALLAVGGLLTGAAQVGFLFPPAHAQQVVPPMRPPTPPPAVDRVLFTVSSPRPLTWRLGTLDVYRRTAWLTPPFDSSTLVPVDGRVPTATGDTRGPLSSDGATTIQVTLVDLGGKALPGLANPLAVRGGPHVLYDPRTQQLRAGGTRPAAGTRYEVTAAAPPTGAALAAAGPPPAAVLPFLDAPAPPPQVVALLAQAPDNPFARLQFLRRAYFAKVVAAGAGNPVDVPPARVGEMLEGREASPYEITAGEALLARWCGVPARIGYGWFGGQPTRTAGVVEIRPRNGATWLEAYFAGSGWVPIVGVPPRAKASLRAGQRNTDPTVRPTDELALVVYVPVRQRTFQLAYVLVRYYLLAALPVLGLGGLLLAGFPGLVKSLRRAVRRRSARERGPQARIAAAYAELRDTATDLGIGHGGLSPLEFCDRVAEDPEHRELAWLVTRALWGDLTRDLGPDDVDEAEVMARSVQRRLRSAQPAAARLAAFVSRASLRSPWTRELPTLWVAGRPGRRPRPPSRRRDPLAWARGLPRLSPSRAVAVTLAVALVPVIAAGVLTRGGQPRGAPPVVAPPSDRLVPQVLGDLRFVREPAAEEAFRSGLAVGGRVFSVHQGDVVQASLQVAELAPDVDTRSPRVRDQVLGGFAGGRFSPARVGDERLYRLVLPEQTLLLAFGRDGHTYELMAARAAFGGAGELFARVLAYGRGESADQIGPDVVAPDPRRGSAQ